MENYILTRYLYSYMEVKQSLFLSILKKDFKQSLFWGYELYFSGFQEETFDYFIKMIDEVYKKKPVSLKKSIQNEKNSWVKDNTLHLTLGKCISILCMNEFNLAPFIKEYFGVNCKKEEQNTTIKEDHYKMTNELLKPLCTFDDHSVSAYNVLKMKQTHSPEKRFIDLLKISYPEDMTDLLSDKWLYYASISPIWHERIKQHNGVIDEEKQAVRFEDDDNIDTFYSSWGYDPDEQSKQIQLNMGGKETIEQLDLTAFCNEFHYRIPKTRRKKTVAK